MRTSASALRRGLLATLALLLVGVAMGAGFLRLDLDARLGAANDMVLGTVMSVDVEQRQGEPWTVVSLQVERIWLQDGRPWSAEDGEGFGDSGIIQAWFWGGHAPGLPSLLVAGMPGFEVGERIIWMLHAQESAQAAATVGVGQGVWRERDGGWLGDDGRTLGLDGDGRLALDGAATDEASLFAAIEAAVERLRGEP